MNRNPYNWFSFAAAFKENGPWVQSKFTKEQYPITSIRKEGITIGNSNDLVNWEWLNRMFTWTNGQPCGAKVFKHKYTAPTITEIKHDVSINLHASSINPGHGGTPPGHGGEIPGHHNKQHGLEEDPFNQF